MKNIKSILARLENDNAGQDLIEYALIAGLIGIAAISCVKGYGTAVATAFNVISSSLHNAI